MPNFPKRNINTSVKLHENNKKNMKKTRLVSYLMLYSKISTLF